ncbi:PadR family transcriptional regulator [Streptomyces sp. SP18CS02]|uniref:PadR family transcriptional regulator n=1 Tax=Streptomyces sp. SP18CS02 TaxID=3002531 RepID=UPI002E764954|nr:PadR family transcriptional regulator [Streptomyces sp. SP18CS02]MEE1757026.1 PadR family transcriptional regulator [Streptomyces sp. SP18CS02]
MAADRRSSWLKGVLDLLVLSCLTEGESYGYEISKAMAAGGLGEIKGGTLYPVLNRLEEAGLVVGEFRAAERGPGRRYYRLTDDGRAHLAAESDAWLDFHTAVKTMLHPGGTTR